MFTSRQEKKTYEGSKVNRKEDSEAVDNLERKLTTYKTE